MKKTYINPTTVVVKIALANIIASSPNVQLYGTNATDKGMSRRGGSSVWDDDEEEY